MAASSISRTTARCFQACNALWHNAASRSISRRSFYTSSPLYLDFLAPLWSAQPLARPSFHQHCPKSTSRSAQKRLLSSTPRHGAVAIQNARKDDSGNDRIITISPRAAIRLQTIASKDANPNTALRVAVESGGCHGFQYLISLTDLKDADPEEDTVFEHKEVVSAKGGDGDGYKAKIVIDEPSLELLGGSTIDYTMELIGSQFKVTGIPGATSSCGCGSSFDVAA